jgi:hypothetical protein
MKTLISTVSLATLMGISSVAGIAPANAAMFMGNPHFQQQDQYIGNFCDRHPNANQCNDFRSNHRHWSNNQYQSFYRYHRNDNDFGGNVAAGLFGFAAGAIIAGAITSNSGDNGYSSDHVSACQSAYRSYDVRSDSYMGYDGARHRCAL